MRRGGFLIALVVWGLVGKAAAELSLFSIPGNSTWGEIKQRSVSENTHIELIDLESYENGIGPIQPARSVPVPEISLTMTAAEAAAVVVGM